MTAEVCSVCGLPRNLYKCARCGAMACTTCYGARRARCEPCLRKEGRRLRRGILRVFG